MFFWHSGSESGTWDSGFGIEDLGLGIWDLDSFLTTDPFDLLGVAQLSKIFLLYSCLSNLFEQDFPLKL